MSLSGATSIDTAGAELRARGSSSLRVPAPDGGPILGADLLANLESSQTNLVTTGGGETRQFAAGVSSLSRWLRPLATSALLVGGDVLAYLAAFIALLPFRPSEIDSTTSIHVHIFIAFVALVAFASKSLYPGYGIYAHELMRRRAMASLEVAVPALCGAWLMSGAWYLSLLIACFLGIGLIVQSIMRDIARRVSRRLGIWGERATIIADPDLSAALIEHFSRNWQYGLQPEPLHVGPAWPANFKARKTALVAGNCGRSLDDLVEMARDFTEVILLANTPGLKLGGLQPVDVGGQIGLRLAVGRKMSSSNIVRRFIDLAVSIPATLLAIPVIALAGLAIYVMDPGSIFFWQAREGLGGRSVRILKLRTMYKDADQRLEALLRDDPTMRAEWSTHFKLRQDPRIIPVVGRLLRQTSCDELPQLFNVITGDIALVGPRPFPEYHLMAMPAEFRRKRHSVIPGLTGLWQVSERSNADLELQQQIDEFYIDNRSLWFDLHILLMTIPAVFKRGGAY